MVGHIVGGSSCVAQGLAGAGIVRAGWVSVGFVCRCLAAESSYPLMLHVSMAGSVGQRRV